MAQCKKPKEGGAGSGRHKSVGDAIDEHNDQARKKMAASTVKQSAKPRTMGFIARFKEASADPSGAKGKRFRVTMLQEGLGNFGDCFYYTRSAIESAPPVFEGKKFMINHPSSFEDEVRPERDVRDISGYFENCAAEEADDGRMNLMGDLVVAGSPADPSDPFKRERVLILESLDYAKKHQDQDLVALSINAGGDFEEMPVAQFLESVEIPDACKPKLAEAVEQGVDTIRPVSAMRMAVSCDLVTTAGAGGSFNQLLEGGKGTMGKITQKQAKQTESEESEESEHEAAEKEAHEAEEGEEGEGLDSSGKDDDGAADKDADDQGDHADADQDKELIAQMLDKYVGKPAHSDDDLDAMKQAYESAMEAGYEGKEAEKVAGAHLKMCKQTAMKQAAAQKEADGGVGFDAKSGAVKDAGSSKDMQKNKESAKGGDMSTIKLTARVAFLESELAKGAFEKHKEKSLRESKLPRAATKKFLECVKTAKTTKEFDQQLATFKEAFSLRGEADETEGFVMGVERSSGIESSESGMDFSDCVAA
jgi:hypothetical protein